MNAQEIEAKLADELNLKTTGFVTFIEFVPGGTTKDGNGYGPCGYDVVALDHDGRTVAYRYSDDSIDTDWQIGTVEDVAEAAAATGQELIAE